MNRSLVAAFAIVGVCVSLNARSAIETKVSSRVVTEIQNYIESAYSGTEEVESVEGAVFQEMEKRVFGYNVRTVSVADTASGRNLMLSLDGDKWVVWQKSSWIELKQYGFSSRVAVMDSVSTDLGRKIISLVVPALEENEFISSIYTRRVRKSYPKYGVDKRTHTHEIMTGYEGPKCQEGRIFRAVVTGDSVVIEGVGEWVF